MFVVKQDNDYSCVLACVESFLRDSGTTHTQAEMVVGHPTLCHAGEEIEGAFNVSLENLQALGDSYGFEVTIPSGCPPVGNEETYLLVTTDLAGQGVSHCVRWSGHVRNGCLEVMDPNANRGSDKVELSRWSGPVVAQAKCLVFMLRQTRQTSHPT